MNLQAISNTPGVVTPFGKLSVERRGKMLFTMVTDPFGRKRIAGPLTRQRTLFSSMCGQHWRSQAAIFADMDRREELAEAQRQRELDDQGRDFERAITAIAQASADGRYDVMTKLGFHR